ncbi:Polycystic kidney disease protein 1-like 2, partial [Biomphalaria glabrata]
RVVTVLEDNREDHTFVYLLCVVTGWFARASTTSNIFFTVKGSWDKSESHLLSDPNKRLFQ